VNEIANPDQKTYWIITDGASYGTGVTDVGQTTTVGAGWSIWWHGTDTDEYSAKCSEVALQPIVS
jgi:hypothetical protein